MEQAAVRGVPPHVEDVLGRLEAAGHEAWCVGGCVRDTLLGRAPADWDVCTSALPQETKAALGPVPTAEIGAGYGTVTALTAGGPVEITTYRREGPYSDHRRPDSVTFSRSLADDLQRRDFTINAMAAHPRRGLRDPFGGRGDLHRQVLRCVGSPARRFGEDALRILRCLRFGAVLGFSIEEATEKALFACAPLLETVSAQRVLAEMDKLLEGEWGEGILKTYADIFCILFPEKICADISHTPPQADARWAALLKGVPEPQALLSRLCFPNRRRRAVLAHLAGDPLTLDRLQIKGRDLLELGYAPGPRVGEALHRLLKAVQDGVLPNERTALLGALCSPQAKADGQGLVDP